MLEFKASGVNLGVDLGADAVPHDDIDPMFRAADSANETLPCKAMFHSHLYHSPPLPKPESYFCEPGGWRLDGHHQLHL